MNELRGYEFLSWTQFLVIAILTGLVFFILSRFHLFIRHEKNKSIGFRMLDYLLIMLIVVSFILIRPFDHLLLVLVVFGLFFKNIVSYSRALFSLFYSNVNFGDRIKIGDVSGTLKSMNFGGLHILTEENRVYFPFNMWKENKIVLESESGKILVSFECTEDKGRNEHHSIHDLEKSLFNYPYLAASNVFIDKESDVFKVVARISDPKYRSGLLSHIDKAGFRLKGNKI